MHYLQIIPTPPVKKRVSKSEAEFNKALLEQEELEEVCNRFEAYCNRIESFTYEINSKFYDEKLSKEKEFIDLLIRYYTEDIINLSANKKSILKEIILDKILLFSSIDYKYYTTCLDKIMSQKEKIKLENEKLKLEHELKNELGFEFNFDAFNDFEFKNADIDSEEYKNNQKAADYLFNKKKYRSDDFEDFFEPTKPKNIKEDINSMNISKLFKEIALKIHPDREQDDAKREIKEQLMKRLTEARSTNNLFEIIKIALDANKYRFLVNLNSIIDQKNISNFTKIVRQKNKEIEKKIIGINSKFSSFISGYVDISKMNDKKLLKIMISIEKNKKLELDSINLEIKELINKPKSKLNKIISDYYYY